MADLDYTTLVGRLALTVGDGEDIDDDPDTIWCDEGTVRLIPLISIAKVAGGTPVPWTGGKAVIDCEIDVEGYITYRGKRFVRLVDLTSEKINPHITDGRATHRVEFRDVKAQGTKVDFPTASIPIAGDTINDLTLLMPAPTGGGTPIIVGPRGTGVAGMLVESGDLIVELTDGETINAGELPVGPGGSDAGVAGYIATPGSATSESINAKIATGVAGPLTVDALLDSSTPIVLGHRGGGANIWPDGSLEGMIDAAQLGAHGIEADLRRLLGGGLGVMHDETIDRTTTTVGTVADLTAQTWRSLELDPSAWSFPIPGWPSLKAPTWADVVAQVGGLALLVPEVRGVGLAVDDAREVIRLAKSARIEKTVIVQSFVWDACVASVADGVDAMYLDGAGTTRTPAELVAAGVRFLGADSALITDATLAAHAAAGVNVIVWTINHQSAVDAWVAKGARGVFSDDPIYASRAYSKYRLAKAPWTKNPRFYPGHLPYARRTGFNPFVLDGSDYWFQPDTSGTYQLGSLSPVASPDSYTLTVPIKLVTVGSDATQWTGVYFSATKDGSNVADVADGYLVMIRQNGTLQLYRRATGAGSFTSLGTAATPALESGTTATITITVTPTSVTVTRTGVSAPNSVTANDTQVRGGYISLRDNGQNSGGRTARFGAITVA